MFFILHLSLWWVASCHTRLVPGADRDTSAVLLKRKWKKKNRWDSPTAIYVREWLQLIGCSSSSSTHTEHKSDECGLVGHCRRLGTTTKDEWSVLFSAESPLRSWTRRHILLFYNSHCSCHTHLFCQHYLVWEYINVTTNKNTPQAFRTSSLTTEGVESARLLSKCWHLNLRVISGGIMVLSRP